MDNEQIYETAFQIIVHAGESRSLSSEAIDSIERYDFNKAEELLEKANQEFLECHKIQTDLLTAEANGESSEVNIILVHSQDHLTMATMAMDNAKRYMNVYKKLEKFEEK